MASAREVTEKGVERIIETEVDENAWRQHITRYEFAKQFVEGQKVLDVACGTGYGTYFLARNAGVRITGVDVSREAVEYATTHYKHPELEYACGDALEIARYAGVDTVVSLETIEHLQEPEKFLTAVTQILPRHGQFIVSTPNRISGSLSDKPRNPYHVREWSSAEFMQLLRRYFDKVEFYDQFVYVAPNGIPGGRTLARLILRLVRPRLLRELTRWEVIQPIEAKIPLVRLEPRYVVAVCKEPRKM